MWWQNNKRQQTGLSLIEASMVLVLSAVVVAGVMVYYQTAQKNNNLDKLSSQIMHMVSEINGLYAGAAKVNGGTDYTGLVTPNLITAIADLEPVMTSNGPDTSAIKTAFPEIGLGVLAVHRDTSAAGGISSATPSDRFIILAQSANNTTLDKVFCTKLMSINFGSQAEYYLQYNSGSSTFTTVATEKPFSERLALCDKLASDDFIGVVFK
jgi:hypothetical protein